MKAIERHRQTWQGKSDEWLFERLDNELKQKIEEIHRLLAENEALRQPPVISSVCKHPMRRREYYRDKCYKCFECLKIVVEQTDL